MKLPCRSPSRASITRFRRCRSDSGSHVSRSSWSRSRSVFVLKQPTWHLADDLGAGCGVIFFAGSACVSLRASCCSSRHGPGGLFLASTTTSASVHTMVDPSADPLGAGYQLLQGQIAIGQAASPAKASCSCPEGLEYIPERTLTSSSRSSPGIRLRGSSSCSWRGHRHRSGMISPAVPEVPSAPWPPQFCNHPDALRRISTSEMVIVLLPWWAYPCR